MSSTEDTENGVAVYNLQRRILRRYAQINSHGVNSWNLYWMFIDLNLEGCAIVMPLIGEY